MNEMKEAVGNWREAKQFSPADENDFLRWLDKADTEEKQMCIRDRRLAGRRA